MIGPMAEGHAYHARARRRPPWAVEPVGQRGKTAAHAHQVGGMAKVGRAVDQGAVEVEQHRLQMLGSGSCGLAVAIM